MALSKMSLDNLENREIVDFEGAKRSNASKVWAYFGFFKENGVVNKSQTVCKLCHAVKAYKGGNTSNMNAHLNAFHCDIVNPPGQGSQKKQATITSAFGKLDVKPLCKDGQAYKDILNF